MNSSNCSKPPGSGQQPPNDDATNKSHDRAPNLNINWSKLESFGRQFLQDFYMPVLGEDKPHGIRAERFNILMGKLHHRDTTEEEKAEILKELEPVYAQVPWDLVVNKTNETLKLIPQDDRESLKTGNVAENIRTWNAKWILENHTQLQRQAQTPELAQSLKELISNWQNAAAQIVALRVDSLLLDELKSEGYGDLTVKTMKDLAKEDSQFNNKVIQIFQDKIYPCRHKEGKQSKHSLAIELLNGSKMVMDDHPSLGTHSGGRRTIDSVVAFVRNKVQSAKDSFLANNRTERKEESVKKSNETPHIALPETSLTNAASASLPGNSFNTSSLVFSDMSGIPAASLPHLGTLQASGVGFTAPVLQAPVSSHAPASLPNSNAHTFDAMQSDANDANEVAMGVEEDDSLFCSSFSGNDDEELLAAAADDEVETQKALEVELQKAKELQAQYIARINAIQTKQVQQQMKQMLTEREEAAKAKRAAEEQKKEDGRRLAEQLSINNNALPTEKHKSPDANENSKSNQASQSSTNPRQRKTPKTAAEKAAEKAAKKAAAKKAAAKKPTAAGKAASSKTIAVKKAQPSSKHTFDPKNPPKPSSNQANNDETPTDYEKAPPNNDETSTDYEKAPKYPCPKHGASKLDTDTSFSMSTSRNSTWTLGKLFAKFPCFGCGLSGVCLQAAPLYCKGCELDGIETKLFYWLCSKCAKKDGPQVRRRTQANHTLPGSAPYRPDE